MSDVISDIPTKMEYGTIEDELLHTLANVVPFTPSTTASTPEFIEQSVTPEPTSADKKPVKKRKSWGQELPTPTTNLPPRKRAKTEAEKEQRRIERVLRNRAAAQSSRERKRKEVEALEDVKNNLADENQALRDSNVQLAHENVQLRNQLATLMAETKHMKLEFNILRQQLGLAVPEYHTPESEGSPTIPNLLTPNSVSHDSFSDSSPEAATPPPIDGTLDPSDLTTPVKSEEGTFGLTQHSAAMLCSQDLPCQPIGPSSTLRVTCLLTMWTICSILTAVTPSLPLEMPTCSVEKASRHLSQLVTL